jgi:outer membrane receptor for ferrienterochelin and colicins
MINLAFPFVLLLFVSLVQLVSSANAAEAVISKDIMSQAQSLFGGPSEDDYYKTDEMLITATGSAKPVFLAPSVATVISKEKIEQLGARTLTEVLEIVPGLHVAPSSTFGPLVKNFHIRGIATATNPQVLVLVNGVQIEELLNGYRGMRFDMPLSMVSRIEVIRGPGSAIHGANAFAGTINIITKDGQEIDGVSAGVRHGSFEKTDAWLQYGGNHNGWDVVASLELMNHGTDSDRVIDSDLQTLLNPAVSLAPGPVNTDIQQTQYNLGFSKDEWTLRLMGWLHHDAGVGVGIGPVLDPAGRHEEDYFMADLVYHNEELHPDWNLDWRLNYTYQDTQNHFNIFPPGTTLPIGPDGNLNFVNVAGVVNFPGGYRGNPGSTHKILSTEVIGLFDGHAQHNVRLALGYKFMDFTARSTTNFGPALIGNPPPAVVGGQLTDISNTLFDYMPDKQRKVWHVSIQDEWAFARDWEFTLGARYDDFSDFGSTTNPRLALVWQARHDLTAKLLYGEAFRAPAFSEQYAINNPATVGNPDLSPETIDTVELSLEWRPNSSLRLATSLYAYEIKDLIEVVADPGGASSTYQNSRDQDGKGIEIEADWIVSDQLSLSANGSWQNNEDPSTGMKIADTPAAQLYLNAHWKFLPGWSLDGQWFWVGDRQRPAGDTRQAIDDYNKIDLTLRRSELFEGVDVALAARNVFDEDIREPGPAQITNDYPMNGREIWAEIKVSY